MAGYTCDLLCRRRTLYKSVMCRCVQPLLLHAPDATFIPTYSQRTRNKRSRFQWSVNMTDVDSNIQRPAESYQLRNLTSPIPILKPEGINVKYYDA